ncbi:MAG: phage tail sheath C-terminal domain-containing protein [Calothrix sp. MO_167.B42]|nr:phage tail sheath C-terminal domain-containing protein [Calothrix sp. MO_167.B42]
MASSYKTPGVYIEEISKFPPSIAEVATAIPVFIGYTEQAIVRGVDYHKLAADAQKAAEEASDLIDGVADPTSLVDAAVTAVDAAVAAVNEAKTAVDAELTDAQTEVDAALAAVNEAKAAADAAKTAVDAAVAAPEDAAAQTAADTAAQTAADAAKAAADAAKTAADAAKAAVPDDGAADADNSAQVAAADAVDAAKVAVDEAADAAAKAAKAVVTEPADAAAAAAQAKAVADAAKVAIPVRITSLLEYEQYFGTTEPETGIVVTIEEKLDKDGKVTDRKVSGKNETPSNHNMYYAMQAYFANGGGPCYIVSVGKIKTAAGIITAQDLQDGIKQIAKEDEVTLFVFPESQSLSSADRTGVFGDAIQQCFDLQDRFAIFDMQVPEEGETILAAAGKFRDLSLNLDALKYAAVYTPNVETIFNYEYDQDEVTLVHSETLHDRTVQDGKFHNEKMSALAPDKDDKAAGDAILLNLVKAAIDAIPIILPPSPLVAGQYAFVDNTRGVFKAPANVALSSVIKPTIKITNLDQDNLNIDTSGKSINAIRAFTGKGTLIWGARTLAGNDNEWRYVPVRRFFNMAEESIKKGTEQFVFEPNDANTWTKVRAMIDNFLILQWRAGALQGAKPEQAFFVKVGLNETMTALDILEGRMIIEIGMAVVRPAEFIILRFSHMMAES